MKALITGGQGYVGNYLTKKLLDDGHKVVTLDTGTNSKYVVNFTNINYANKLVRHQASILNLDAVYRAMEGVDIIYHLAARTDWDKSWRHPTRVIETNVQGSANVLAMARRTGISKVVLASSAAVYGNIVGAKTTDPCVPVNMYGASKLAMEAVCRGFYSVGMEIIILRLSNIWGKKGSNSIVNKFASGYNVIYGDGSQTRDFVHIDDVIRAFVAVKDSDSAIYNISSNEEVTIEGLYRKLNSSEPVFTNNDTGNDEIYRNCLDNAETYKILKWKPKHFISELSSDEIRQMCE